MKLSISLFFASQLIAHSTGFTQKPLSFTPNNSALKATIAPASGLIPPVTEGNDNDIIDLYDSTVQKTYGRYSLTITHGKGCTLYSKDDKSYLDFVAGIATCALGHGSEELANAISKQMSTLHHISNLYYIPQQANLAKWLTDNSVADKVFFCNSGAESNEAAIKCARKHAANRGITDPVIITAKNSFHGRTLATITATGQPKYHQGFTYGGKMVDGFEYVEYNNVEELKKLFEEINTTPKELEEQGRKRGVAAIMMEALQGEGGVMPGTPEFFTAARQLCDDSNALLICDEVQIGMGRSGKLWGYENLPDNIQPDIFTSAKALGGGVPIGAMMARGEAANTFGPGDHASTYGGNPLACAAGLAVAKYFSDHNILQNVQERSEELVSGLNKLAEKYPDILSGEVRGWGLLIGVDVRADIDTTAGDVVGKAMEEGLLLVPAGPKVIRFVPPLIVSKEEIAKALDLFEKALQQSS